jgi:hypothetical protein
VEEVRQQRSGEVAEEQEHSLAAKAEERGHLLVATEGGPVVRLHPLAVEVLVSSWTVVMAAARYQLAPLAAMEEERRLQVVRHGLDEMAVEVPCSCLEAVEVQNCDSAAAAGLSFGLEVVEALLDCPRTAEEHQICGHCYRLLLAFWRVGEAEVVQVQVPQGQVLTRVEGPPCARTFQHRPTVAELWTSAPLVLEVPEVVKDRLHSLLWSLFSAPGVGVVPKTCFQLRQMICQLVAEEAAGVVIHVHSVLEAVVVEARAK